MFITELSQVVKSSRELAPRLLENQFNNITLAFLEIFVRVRGFGCLCDLSEDFNNFPPVGLDCVHGSFSFDNAAESFANAL